MQLQQIKYFLVLHEELSFTRAARRCGVSQPSLTGCIKRLEAELGGPLFAASGKYPSPILVVRWRHISSGSSKTRKMH